MNSSPDIGNAPEKAPHFFTRVFFQFIPEVSYQELVELSQLANANGREKLYTTLCQALQKIQWAKIAGIRAHQMDRLVAEEHQPGEIVHDFMAQIEHEKALAELVSHIKAALDALAVFLNDYWSLGKKGGDRDLKWSRFRTSLTEAEPTLEPILSDLTGWLDGNSPRTESIVAVRDAWLHTGIPNVPQLWPPSEVGAYPVPKQINGEFSSEKKDYWHTATFVNHHLTNFFQLFTAVLTSCIRRERSDQPNLKIEKPENVIPFFPLVPWNDASVESIKVGGLTQQYLAGGMGKESD